MDVELEHLTRRYRSAGVFDLHLHVASGEFLAIVGSSGAGKTTMLHLIAGLVGADRGVVRIGGRDVTRLPPHERNIGLVSQTPAIYPHLSVTRNLSIGQEMWQSRYRAQRIDRPELQRRVAEAIELLELSSILDRRAEELSSGEAQRVALGRLMVRRPPVWLLDEPLSHLDAGRKMEFRRHLHLLHAVRPATMILVTHDPVEAPALGQRVAVLEAGRLLQVGAPVALYERPAHRLVAERIGWPPLNLADGVLTRADGMGGNLRFAAADGAFHLPVPAELVTHDAGGQPVAVGIRADELLLTSPTDSPVSDEGLRLPGWRVTLVEYIPPRWLATVERGRTRWRCWCHSAPVRDEEITLAVPVQRLHWFDGQTGNRLGMPPSH